VIEMSWLDDFVIPALFILVIYLFVVCVRFRTRGLTRKTTRTAENMYPLYADSIKKQQKYAKEHGGTWKADDGLDADVADIMRRHGAS
jgi:membrane protein insertase Oxa1/YidC/SpoIIIJ